MPEWSTACVDWAERIREGRSIIPPPIFPEEAEAGLAVMRDLRIVDAPGSPRMADACGPWIFDLAATIFGAYDAQSGRRLIKEWFVMLPKKNFKSGLAATALKQARSCGCRARSRSCCSAGKATDCRDNEKKR